MDTFNAVGYPTGIRQFLNQLLNPLRTLGNFLDEFHVTCRKSLGAVGIEDSLHTLNVLDELALVMCRNGNNMVHGQIAQHTSFYLYGFDIHLPFHFIAGFQLLAIHDLDALKHLDA